MENKLTFHFTNEKAGMVGLNKEQIDRIIFDATKNSAITKKKISDLERIKRVVDEYKIKLKNISQNAQLFDQNKRLADLRMKSIKENNIYDKIWMHIDMDMFYAAVEIRDNPELKDKPVAVGGLGMVATSNYVARKYGIRAAMPGFIAKKLCKDLIFIKPNFKNYTVNITNKLTCLV